MSYLLRVELPDVPGSLGRLAAAIGEAGGNINAIEIVARTEGRAVDDVFILAEHGVMPDSVVSACQQLEGVEVLWISRYAAGTNLFLDLEAVESMSENPAHAVARLVELLPEVFRVDWGMDVRRDGRELQIVHRTSAAPERLLPDLAWPEDSGEMAIGDTLLVWALIHPREAIVMARRGGPAFLPSEVARLGHLAQLARSIGHTPTPRR